MKSPENVESYAKVIISSEPSEDSSDQLDKLLKFLGKCGSYITSLQFSCSSLLNSLMDFLKLMPNLSTLRCSYRKQNQFMTCLEAISDAIDSKKFHFYPLSTLIFMPSSTEENCYLYETHISKLAQLELKLIHLELGHNFWEDVTTATFQNLLRKYSQSLEKFIMHGGIFGTEKKDKLFVKVPRMSVLKYLSIGSEYEFASVFQNPLSLRVNHEIQLDVSDKTPEPIALELFFEDKLPSLKYLQLGGLNTTKEFHFGCAPNLSVFRVAGPWHLDCSFGVRNPVYPNIVEIQIPDNLLDHSFITKLPSAFPLLKKVHLFLPSAKVLLTFFDAFKNAQIEDLHIKVQFDFESTLESCLLGHLVNDRRSQKDILAYEKLKRYRHYEEFVKFYSIQPPLTYADFYDCDDEVGSLKNPPVGEEPLFTCGIGALKQLKTLRLEHIPRVLRIPREGETKKWWNHGCSLSQDTIGFAKYPLSKNCLAEMPLDSLQHIEWPNFDVSL